MDESFFLFWKNASSDFSEVKKLSSSSRMKNYMISRVGLEELVIFIGLNLYIVNLYLIRN